MLLVLAFFGVTACGVVAQQPTDAAGYRKHALTHEGDAVRGAKLFQDDPRTACARCHSIDGSASKAGPDLSAAGDTFGRRDLVDAILAPSATIAPGYGTVILELTDGMIITGTLKQKNDATVQVMGADGRLMSVAAREIKNQSGSAISLMPEGLHAGLSREEFTDLVEYLTTLRERESTGRSAHGMPREIAPLKRPIAVRPFFGSEFVLPRVKAETGLSSMRQVPGADNVFLVLHQQGLIWRAAHHDGREEKNVFLDLRSEVFSERGPNGLLDVAFHPQFQANGRYYLFYQVFAHGTVASRIVEREFDVVRGIDSGKPARFIWGVESVAEDHSGGCLQFGPDGFLYIAMGDTEPHNDPNGHAQNLSLPLGKLIRIDIDHAVNGLAYAIPADNPFRDQANVPPEIWAFGFRNPWRFSFDRLTGKLWLADVGQDRVEEVDIVQRGGNYGWNVFEGFEPFSNQFRKADRTYTLPVFGYHRKYGNSITGGHVYRGDARSSFFGVYVCGDYTSKRIFGLREVTGVLTEVRQIGLLPQRIASFSEDAAMNLYGVGYEGMIYQLDFSQAKFE
jgi:putative heme-binding domain-containing protein